MGIMTALALLAGGVGGYTRGQEAKRQEKRQDEDDAFNREKKERQRIDWQRQDEQYAKQQAEEGAVKKAAAPTTVEEVPQLDLGDPEAAPTVSRFKAGGQMVDTRADADQTAVTYNATPARMRRAAGAMSDPVRAGQLEASAQTAEAGAMQMRAAKLKEADEAFNRDLVQRATTFDALAGIINESKGDGQAGALKVQVVPSADGKTVALHKVNPDGTTAPTPFTFQNTTEGLQQAVGIIGMRLPAEQKLAHLQGQAKTDEDRRRWNLEFGLKEKDSETRGKREDRMATAAERQAAAAERTATAAADKAARAGAPGTLTLADLRDGHKTIATTLNADYKTQLEDVNIKPEAATAIKTTREREIADVQRLYTGAMSAGIALTPEQAIATYRTGKRTTAEVPDTEGKKHTIEVMVVGNRLIPFAPAPGKDAPKPAAPAAAASAPKPAAKTAKAGGATGTF